MGEGCGRMTAIWEREYMVIREGGRRKREEGGEVRLGLWRVEEASRRDRGRERGS